MPGTMLGAGDTEVVITKSLPYRSSEIVGLTGKPTLTMKTNPMMGMAGLHGSIKEWHLPQPCRANDGFLVEVA